MVPPIEFPATWTASSSSASDEGVEPTHLIGIPIRPVVPTRALTEAGKVERDHSIVRREPPRVLHPMIFLREDPVQQEHRLSRAAFEVMEAVVVDLDRTLREPGERAIQGDERPQEELG